MDGKTQLLSQIAQAIQKIVKVDSRDGIPVTTLLNRLQAQFNEVPPEILLEYLILSTQQLYAKKSITLGKRGLKWLYEDVSTIDLFTATVKSDAIWDVSKSCWMATTDEAYLWFLSHAGWWQKILL